MCLRLCVICRPTREEALNAARALLPDDDTEKQERKILNSSESQTLKQALAKADEVGWMNQNSVGGARAVLWIVGDHARGNAARVGPGVSCLQGDRYHAVYYFRLAEARRDGDLRTRSYTVG